jgi:hypothetical protein
LVRTRGGRFGGMGVPRHGEVPEGSGGVDMSVPVGTIRRGVSASEFPLRRCVDLVTCDEMYVNFEQGWKTLV